jgi:hypothetical protein
MPLFCNIERKSGGEGDKRYPKKGHLEIRPQLANPWLIKPCALFSPLNSCLKKIDRAILSLFLNLSSRSSFYCEWLCVWPYGSSFSFQDPNQSCAVKGDSRRSCFCSRSREREGEAEEIKGVPNKQVLWWKDGAMQCGCMSSSFLPSPPSSLLIFYPFLYIFPFIFLFIFSSFSYIYQIWSRSNN